MRPVSAQRRKKKNSFSATDTKVQARSASPPLQLFLELAARAAERGAEAVTKYRAEGIDRRSAVSPPVMSTPSPNDLRPSRHPRRASGSGEKNSPQKLTAGT